LSLPTEALSFDESVVLRRRCAMLCCALTLALWWWDHKVSHWCPASGSDFRGGLVSCMQPHHGQNEQTKHWFFQAR